jgi:hypothetical protein
MTELNDHTDAELARREHDAEMGGTSASEQRWLKFCSDVEELLELDSLDGDEAEDGYSLDGAHESFEAGRSARDYTRDVSEKRRDMGLGVL